MADVRRAAHGRQLGGANRRRPAAEERRVPVGPGIGAVIQFALILIVIAFIARGNWGLLALRRPQELEGRARHGRPRALRREHRRPCDPSRSSIPGASRASRRHAGSRPTRRSSHSSCSQSSSWRRSPRSLRSAVSATDCSRPFGLALAIVGSAVLWAFAHGLLDALPRDHAARHRARVAPLPAGQHDPRDDPPRGLQRHRAGRRARDVIRAAVIAVLIAAAAAWVAYEHVWRNGDAHPLAYRLVTVPNFEAPHPLSRVTKRGGQERVLITAGPRSSHRLLPRDRACGGRARSCLDHRSRNRPAGRARERSPTRIVCSCSRRSTSPYTSTGRGAHERSRPDHAPAPRGDLGQ